MQTGTDTVQKIVRWHRDLPALSADVIGEDTVEATSHRVQGSLSHRQEAIRARYEFCA